MNQTRRDILKAGGAALICTYVGAGVSACAMVSGTSSTPAVPPLPRKERIVIREPVRL